MDVLRGGTGLDPKAGTTSFLTSYVYNTFMSEW
jgi:hypothetical protein